MRFWQSLEQGRYLIFSSSKDNMANYNYAENESQNDVFSFDYMGYIILADC